MEKGGRSFKKRVRFFFISPIVLLLLLGTTSFVYGQWSYVNPPTLSGSWTLTGVHFTSPGEGWAVGADLVGGGEKGVLLRYSGGTWTSINPPSVSQTWNLYGVHFTSPGEGWAVGINISNNTGTILHCSGGTWTSKNPPYVSPSWKLFGVYFTSPCEGWAVGQDVTNHKGVILHYSGGGGPLWILRKAARIGC